MGKKAHQVSIQAIKDNQRTLAKAVTKGWTMASRAPMYCKTTVVGEDDKGQPIVKRRSARLINGDAYRIAASGAAQAASLFHAHELERYGLVCESESVTTPWAPSLSPGAKAMLEQFLVAYCQGALHIARTVMQGCKKHQRLNKQLMDIGFNLMREQVFSDRSPAGRKTVVLPVKKVASGGGKVEANVSEAANTAYEPNPEEDPDAEPAAENEENEEEEEPQAE